MNCKKSLLKDVDVSINCTKPFDIDEVKYDIQYREEIRKQKYNSWICNFDAEEELLSVFDNYIPKNKTDIE